MKKLYVLLFFCVCFSGIGWGQGTGRKSLPKDWHLRSFEKDGVYGAAVYDAYDYLKGREPKRQVVIAVIDGGIDTSHEDLKNNLWVNEGEIPGNGIDDDGNGYVDDVYGWNFLGTPDGGAVQEISREADRLYIQLKDRFENVDTNCLSKKDRKLYAFYQNELLEFSQLAMAYNYHMGMKLQAECAVKFDRELKSMYPGEELTQEHFMALENKYEEGSLEKDIFNYILNQWKSSPKFNWDKMFASCLAGQKSYEKRYQAALKGFEADERANVGDDLNNVKDRFYGNAVMIPHPHGSHVAGIIGATRNNGVGIDGVADVRLMNLRVSAGSGDEYDKDLAVAIRYAVENGANIINLSLGRLVAMHKKWVDDALRFAERKGVLVVHSAGNDGRYVDVKRHQPSKYLDNGRVLKNLVHVGNSNSLGFPASGSNFGKDEVDLFAPGQMIYSAITDNKYKAFSGTSMAAPVVAGVAALIWNYFPELSAAQLRQVLIDGVTSRAGVKVSSPNGIYELGKDAVYFDDLCASGGIVNALESVKLAEKLCKK